MNHLQNRAAVNTHSIYTKLKTKKESKNTNMQNSFSQWNSCWFVTRSPASLLMTPSLWGGPSYRSSKSNCLLSWLHSDGANSPLIGQEKIYTVTDLEFLRLDFTVAQIKTLSHVSKCRMWSSSAYFQLNLAWFLQFLRCIHMAERTYLLWIKAPAK